MPSFTHEDTLPVAAVGFGARGRMYDDYESQVTRVSKDRSDFAARTYKGKIIKVACFVNQTVKNYYPNC